MSEANTASRGHIELICGCMFSGKSERLVERLAEAHARAIPAAAFKHASDDRYARAKIVTHSGRRADAKNLASASDIPDHVGDARLVLIDEAQFFGDDLVTVCRQLAGEGRSVVVAGLDLDSWGLPFGPMPQLEAIADQVTRTHAVCSACGAAADHTQRLTPVEAQRMIGAAEAYEPRCADCFLAPPAELRR